MSALPPPLSREKLKTLRSLTSTRIRKRKGLCLVEGERAIYEAGGSGWLAYLVLSTEELGESTAGKVAARFPDTPIFTLDGCSFSELTDIRSGKGVFGVARIPPGSELESLKEGSLRSALVFLEGLQEPGNVGGIIRTAWALGASGVMMSRGTADPFSTKGIRASAGGVFHIPIHYGIDAGALNELRGKGFSVYLAQAGGPDWREVDFPDRSILALGSEGHGFSREIREMGQPLGIPMAKGVDSLNVVVAGSIILAKMIADSRFQIPDSK